MCACGYSQSRFMCVYLGRVVGTKVDNSAHTPRIMHAERTRRDIAKICDAPRESPQ